MQDVMLAIYKAVKNSEAAEMFAGIYNNRKAPDDTVWPRLTMFEVRVSDGTYADDRPLTTLTYARLDIWSKQNNLFELSKAVKKAIEDAFDMCKVELKQDMYEETESGRDTGIYHKPIDVTIRTEQ